MNCIQSECAHVNGELVEDKLCYDDNSKTYVGTTERKDRSSSDNDVTATLSITSSSHGSSQVLTETDGESNQEASPSPKRSPRRKSNLGKTDSMLKGSLIAVEFFRTEKVFQECDYQALDIGDSKLLESTCSTSPARNAPPPPICSYDMPSKPKDSEAEIKPTSDHTDTPAASSDISSPTVPDSPIDSKCQCIIL